ncbi:MAG: isoleucine--tRNA ligase [Candidatus Latescibacterota bacterium]|nr:isoleucine--tRNA ligase [Candidatus Latescibacterota bacterium]
MSTADKSQTSPTAFDAVPAQVDFPALERKILDGWRAVNMYQRSVDNRPEDRPFKFYDGPPFASGLPHYGHLLASVTKDAVPRYWTMRGYRVERRWGWDCHGLPVENEAEQQLGLRSRRDILDYGVSEFNEFCRSLVLRYTGEWKQLIERLGRWVDWDSLYHTMDPEFMESVWWVFKSLWDSGLVYEGYKSLAYCPRCATPLSNFEVNQSYQDTQDPSITVRFRVRDQEGVSLLAWTTTPWTLTSNMGLAVGPKVAYCRVFTTDGEQLILARQLVDKVFAKRESEIDRVENEPVNGLIGLHYEPLFDYFGDKAEEGAFRVVAADFVSTNDGTGIVHIAPGFGEDDYQLGLHEGLPVVCPIDEDCCFTEEVRDYQGQFVKDVDTPVLRHLRDFGQLFAEGSLVHSYPFCWRCDSPLIYRTISTWFVMVEGEVKERMIAANRQIRWVPDHIRDGRFGKGIESAPDWAISRNRYWGTPLPIWRNEETGETVCVGSRQELCELTGKSVEDLHKHCIDDLEIPAPSGQGVLRRVPEVLDCWFESGSMPYAQSHYPFERREEFEAGFPADFISENLDQTRGWFYTLTVLAAALFDKPAFSNCIVGGMLLASDGRKLSKRLKNYPDPTEMLETYGADALRLYLLNSPAMKAEEMRLTEDGIKQSLRDVIIPLWNVYSFFVMYANIDGWTPQSAKGTESDNRLDRWILSELQTLVHNINEEMEAYRLHRTVPAMVAFVEKLTNWYVRRSRRRFWKSDDDGDKAAAYATLYQVLVTFVKTLAPVLPFFTESIYRNLVLSSKSGQEVPESIHLCDMPQADESLRDSTLEHQMTLAVRTCALGRGLRSKHDIKIRQPLSRIFLLPPDEESREDLMQVSDLIADELNIKEVVLIEDEAEISEVSYKPNFRSCGPRFGKAMKEVGAFISQLSSEQIEHLNDGGILEVGDGEIRRKDVEVQRREREGVVVAVDANLAVGLDLHLSEELVREGIAREVVNRVQNLRKDAGLDVTDRIRLFISGSPAVEQAVVEAHRDYVCTETLAEQLEVGALPEQTFLIHREWEVNDELCELALLKL